MCGIGTAILGRDDVVALGELQKGGVGEIDTGPVGDQIAVDRPSDAEDRQSLGLLSSRVRLPPVVPARTKPSIGWLA